jgi:hypothetical protein
MSLYPHYVKRTQRLQQVAPNNAPNLMFGATNAVKSAGFADSGLQVRSRGRTASVFGGLLDVLHPGRVRIVPKILHRSGRALAVTYRRHYSELPTIRSYRVRTTKPYVSQQSVQLNHDLAKETDRRPVSREPHTLPPSAHCAVMK